MKRPLCGILASRYGNSIGVGRDYLDALWDCGGLGVVLPYTDDTEKIREMAQGFDCFLFAGGGDIHPSFYGEEACAQLDIDGERDLFEYRMFHEIFPTGKPVLGICRGIQVMNVFLGGTLYQHIDGHIQKDRSFVGQDILLEPDGFLRAAVGQEKIKTNSFHHQCVKRLGEGLVCEAVSADGYIEAIRHKEHMFFIGLQWHPELYYKKDPAMRRLFEEFVRVAGDQLPSNPAKKSSKLQL